MAEERALKWTRQAAEPVIEPDESVEVAGVWGQTGASLGGSPAGALTRVVRRASGNIQPRLVFATDQNLYVTRPGSLNVKQVKEVIAKYPLGTVPVNARGLRLSVGEETINIGPASRRHAEDLARVATPPQSGGTA
jgi:hypothetical protein